MLPGPSFVSLKKEAAGKAALKLKKNSRSILVNAYVGGIVSGGVSGGVTVPVGIRNRKGS
jgi:hypothetical protein